MRGGHKVYTFNYWEVLHCEQGLQARFVLQERIVGKVSQQRSGSVQTNGASHWTYKEQERKGYSAVLESVD